MRAGRPGFALLMVSAWCACAQPPVASSDCGSVLLGDWHLDLGHTHYGPGVERRRSESFTCTRDPASVRCVIRSVRSDGQELVGRFAAPLDGTGAPVTGVSGVDEVRLRCPTGEILDATFVLRGAPVFGYRALRSEDGRSLMIVSVDPVSRTVLTTVVVYRLREAG